MTSQPVNTTNSATAADAGPAISDSPRLGAYPQISGPDTRQAMADTDSSQNATAAADGGRTRTPSAGEAEPRGGPPTREEPCAAPTAGAAAQRGRKAATSAARRAPGSGERHQIEAAPHGREAAGSPCGAVIDDPFGLLGSLDLSSLGTIWTTPGQAAVAALAAAGMASDVVIAPPGVYHLAAPAAPAPQPQPAPTKAKASGRRGAQPKEPKVVDAVPQSAPPADLSYDVCAQCGGQMRRGTNNLEYLCDECGLVVEGDTAEPEEDEAPRPAPNAARLRIVGPNSNQLQPDLYRSGSGNTAAAQKKQILEEYKVYRQLYVEAGGRAFPLNALETAAEFYNAVQKQYVKRSQNKKSIMAACLWRACLQIGYAPSKAEVAAFMQLPNKGIARGDNFVRGLVADGKMDLEINADPSRPEITTLFALLSFDGDQYAGLREAVYDVVQTAIKNNIGTNSILRSKVAGATYIVLRRCKDRELIPKPLSMQEFCAKRIRKNTVERFTRELDDYHSYFEECYRKAGLDTAPTRGHH